MLPPDLETSNALSGSKSKSQFCSQVSPSKQRWRHSHPPTRSHWDGQCGFCPHLPCLQMLQFPSQGQGSGAGGGQFPRLLLTSTAAHSHTPASSELATPSFSHWEQRLARQPGQPGPVSTLLHPSLQGLLVQDGGSHAETRERAPFQTYLHVGRLLPRLQSAELGPSEGCHPPLAQEP